VSDDSAVALAKLAESFDRADQKRLAMNKAAKEQEDIAKGLKARLMEAMQKAGLSAAGYSGAVFTLKEEFTPTIQNWSDLRDYIQKTGEFDLLENRLGKAAVQARWENGVDVPGVIKFPITKLSRKGL